MAYKNSKKKILSILFGLVGITFLFSSCLDKFGGHHSPVLYNIYIEGNDSINNLAISYLEAKNGSLTENIVSNKVVSLPYKYTSIANYSKSSNRPEVFLSINNSIDTSVRAILFLDNLNYDTNCFVQKIIFKELYDPTSYCSGVSINQVFDKLKSTNYQGIIDFSSNKEKKKIYLND